MIIGYLIVIALVIIDQISKIIVVNNMELFQQVIFIKPLLNFRFTYNEGAAWSILSDHRWILAIVSVVASGALLYLMKDFNLKKDKIYSISMALITGGAIGNGIDRIFREKGVVDFFEFGFMDFPIFNVADTFLTIGVFMLAIYVLFISKDGLLPFMSKKEDKKSEEENGLS